MNPNTEEKCFNFLCYLRDRSREDYTNYDELNNSIYELLSLDKNCFTLMLSKKEAEKEGQNLAVASLPVMLLDLIEEGVYSNHEFFKLIKKFNLEPLLGQAFSIAKSNLLMDSIYYDNKEFFNFLLLNHLNQFDINYQDDFGDSILHHCAQLSNPHYFVNALLSCENIEIDLSLKNKNNDTIIDLFEFDSFEDIIEMIKAKIEKNALTKKLNHTLSVDVKNKIKI